MSVNSNLLGMQGPNLSNPCASPQVQPMHSEAKMVSNNYNNHFLNFMSFSLISILTSKFQLSQVDGSVIVSMSRSFLWRGKRELGSLFEDICY